MQPQSLTKIIRLPVRKCNSDSPQIYRSMLIVMKSLFCCIYVLQLPSSGGNFAKYWGGGGGG